MAIYLNNLVKVKLATAAAPTVPSIDISDHVSAVTITQTFDELEVTAMGDTAHKFAAGLQAATLTIDFFNDWATSQVMQTLNAAAGTTLAVSMITGTGSAPTTVSAANPTYQFSILVNNLTPVGNGGVADEAASSLSFTINTALTVSPTVVY